MDMRNDFIMRAILMLIEMIRKMLGKGEMQKEVLEQALSDVCGFDVEKLSSLPALLKQMIELSSQSDENKKALAVTCLHLKDKNKFESVCQDLLRSMRWNLLYEESKTLLRDTFGLNETNKENNSTI